jgi:hypothetical protein
VVDHHDAAARHEPGIGDRAVPDRAHRLAGSAEQVHTAVTCCVRRRRWVEAVHDLRPRVERPDSSGRAGADGEHEGEQGAGKQVCGYGDHAAMIRRERRRRTRWSPACGRRRDARGGGANPVGPQD